MSGKSLSLVLLAFGLLLTLGCPPPETRKPDNGSPTSGPGEKGENGGTTSPPVKPADIQ